MLPHRARRQIGPWTFLDHWGPASLAPSQFDVAAHPHCGLSTVTWVVSGQLLHKDSLGTEQIIRPGQLNWMTAGNGISHSEEVPVGAHGDIHGVQLWLALPDADRHGPPSFEHFDELPKLQLPGGELTVFAGSAMGLTSPARVHSPLVGFELAREEAGRSELGLAEEFEHGVVVMEGEASIDGQALGVGELAYLGMGRGSLDVETRGAAKLMVVGGEPLNEAILLWWNFIARTEAEIRQARDDWQAGHERFGTVDAYTRGRLNAPPLP
ncbi:MAG: redox-sensitive bicupin YhaK (pirin superfamily) [Myxococcota bacterium]|jgi:redox-sensitive bicupin YhaK (pirin superfamily)